VNSFNEDGTMGRKRVCENSASVSQGGWQGFGASANGRTRLYRLRKKGTIGFSRIDNGGRVAHISLVFREMWESPALSL
jgi:hypothetical protein